MPTTKCKIKEFEHRIDYNKKAINGEILYEGIFYMGDDPTSRVIFQYTTKDGKVIKSEFSDFLNEYQRLSIMIAIAKDQKN